MKSIQAYQLLSRWKGRSTTHVIARFCDGTRILRRISPEGIWRGRRVNIIGTIRHEYSWSYVCRIEQLTVIFLSDEERESMVINEAFL